MYTDIKQVRMIKRGKQHDNERLSGTKYPRSGGTGENTPFTKQSRKKERDEGHDNG